ncbi:MAG: hypothetical protein AB8D78_09255 [Akkermansiaceae bacterium]
MKDFRSKSPRSILGCCLLLWSSLAGAQEVVSRKLSDAIFKGDGVIDLLNDISGSELTQYFNQTGGLLLLGADVNEDNSGNESSTSQGVAIKQVQLSISTTDGDFTFGDFYTSTTAMLSELGGTTSSEYYTLFGQGGSSQITGSGGFDLSSFDDVLWLEEIMLTGTINRAELSITFLETPNSRSSDSESFFDFSGGFEEFALLATADAVLLEEADLGMADAPTGVTYTTTESATEVIQAAAPAADPNTQVDPPAAPAPPWMVVAGMAGLLLLKTKKAGAHEPA